MLKLNLIQAHKKTAVLGLLSLVLLISTIMLYTSNRTYRSYIDYEMQTDFSNMVQAIDDNGMVYEEILSTGTLNENQRVRLLMTNRDLANLWEKYKRTVVHFKREQREYPYGIISITALKITSFAGEEKVRSLSAKDLAVIENFAELNTLWQEAFDILDRFDSTQKGVYRFRDSLWVERIQLGRVRKLRRRAS
ncbi:hypothetical protein [Saccharibacillus sacchari]|uniref:Uncharacterized protein n=1 Tax=Saccharibacillus sacchari TaxID=456493 RepID=A0ACC6PHS2_9BACL